MRCRVEFLINRMARRFRDVPITTIDLHSWDTPNKSQHHHHTPAESLLLRPEHRHPYGHFVTHYRQNEIIVIVSFRPSHPADRSAYPLDLLRTIDFIPGLELLKIGIRQG